MVGSLARLKDVRLHVDLSALLQEMASRACGVDTGAVVRLSRPIVIGTAAGTSSCDQPWKKVSSLSGTEGRVLTRISSIGVSEEGHQHEPIDVEAMRGSVQTLWRLITQAVDHARGKEGIGVEF